MKTHPMASGLRVTFTKTELQALLKLARFAVDQLPAARHYYILPQRPVDVAADLIKGLELGLASVQFKQAEARERREAPSRANIQRLCERGRHVLVYLRPKDRFVTLATDAARMAFLTSGRLG